MVVRRLLKEELQREIEGMIRVAIEVHLGRREHQELQVMECPVCEHRTLFVKDVRRYLSTLKLHSSAGTTSPSPYDGVNYEGNCDVFICLTCGKTFQKAERQVHELTLTELPADPAKP